MPDSKPLDDFLNLLSDGFITSDIFISDTYITLRTQTFQESENLKNKFKYLGTNYNVFRILHILTDGIHAIGGIKIEDKEKLYFYLGKINLRIILNIYEQYKTLDSRISEINKNFTTLIKQDESKSRWNIYKNFNKSLNLEDIKNMNTYMYHWCLHNLNRDLIDSEIRAWNKTEYETGYICAFLNPKEYRKIKNNMSVVKTMQENDPDHDTYSGEYGNPNDIYDLRRRRDESEEEFAARTQFLMESQMRNEPIDDIDVMIQEKEIQNLKNTLRNMKRKNDILKELRRRRAEDDPDFAVEEDTEFKNAGFYHDGFSYLEKVNQIYFVSIKKEQKQAIFEEIMNEKIENLDELVENYLKSKTEQSLNKPNIDTITFKTKGD